MANFCTKCGSPLTGPFCVKCGTDMRNVGTPPQPQTPSPEAQTPQPAGTPTSNGPAPPKQGMSTLAKLGIAAIAIIFVGSAAGAVGVYYVAHKVSQKSTRCRTKFADQVPIPARSPMGRAPVRGTGIGRSAESGTMGDVCRLLSKQDVSKAVGLEIVRTVSNDNGCSYTANLPRR